MVLFAARDTLLVPSRTGLALIFVLLAREMTRITKIVGRDSIKGALISDLKNLPPSTTNFTMTLKNKHRDIPLELPKDDQVLLLQGFNDVLSPKRHDGKRFSSANENLKNGSPDQNSRCRTCAQECYSPFNYANKYRHILGFTSPPTRHHSFLYYNINSIARACFIFLLSTLMTSPN